MFWKVLYLTHSKVFPDRVTDVKVAHHFRLFGVHEDEGPIAFDEEFHFEKIGEKKFWCAHEKTEAEMTGRKIFVYVQ
jgi:hypothetical protein